ncbi:aliphatic sulfonate ABC transporter substrate-binding protein [Fodinisporobacter ferrooxydans]|uniref:Aliphatic sulfonate ABC transporter substrate-binding protein n=1 Tax=Fodinisporobacter ferrooxydans TaxID=2901836 RepID=A0ABY4CPL9_9BACL|nr:aliphatic sulfonate ABC transporter substrate-binding protein [Alicyclobacillaceae bacterium MYW30-H2]
MILSRISSNKRIIGTFAAVFMVAAILSGCGAGGTATKNSQGENGKSAVQDIKIGYVDILADAPAIIAKEKHTMDQQGVKSEFFAFENGPDLYKALSSGKLDFAYAGVPAAVNWLSRGAQFKIIAKVDDGKFGLLTKASSGIRQPSDLKGKKLGNVVKGSGVDLLVRGFLLPEAGLNQQSVTLVQMNMANMEQAIDNGAIDAAVAGEPFLTFAELRGLKVVKELPDPGMVVLAREAFLKEHPDLVKTFMQGHIASIDFIHQHQQEAAAILAKSFHVPEIKNNGKNYTPTQIMMAAMKRNAFDAAFTNNDIQFYKKIADTNLKLKLIDKPLDITQFIDRSLSQ